MAVAYNPGIITDGLVLCLDAANRKSYPGTGTGWSNLSSFSSSGRLLNGPTFSSNFQGLFGFDGVDDLAEVPSGMFYTYDKEITVSAWLTFNAFNFIMAQSVWNSDSMTTNVWLWHQNNNGLIWYVNDAETWRAVSTAGLTTGIWYNITTTANSNNTLIYVNNALVASGSGISTGIKNVSNSGFGTNDYRFGTSRSPHSGNIANISIYNRALTTTEISQNFNAIRGRFGI